jgi:hypothetical protein
MSNITTKQSEDMSNENTFENVWAALSKLEKTVADLSKNLGGLGNLQGWLTQAMFETGMSDKFFEIGYNFDSQTSRRVFKENRDFLAEADVFLENSECAMPVEIKTELSTKDIDEHIERIETIRRYMDARNDNRKLVGAIAGEIVAENVLRYAHKKGLYVLTQNGDSVAIAAAPHNFQRQEW